MKLKVYFGEQEAGILERHGDAGDVSYSFRYLPEYLNLPSSRPVSVNLPLQREAFQAKELFPFFDNLLAEGWLLEVQATAHKIDKQDKFALISACGLECMGAVSLRGEHDE